ncbi:dihydroneopterin aldolase [Sphingomonas koreensis]|nr:dihydroneopterin aldolase [Sphingomonas koreensis]
MSGFGEWSGAGRFAVRLDGLELQMRLGIHPEEVARPQRVTLSVTLYVDYGAAPPGDDIAAAVDYDFVRSGVLALAERHFHLQEALCETVAALCFADARVRGVRVRSAKPDIYPDASVGCEIVRANPA